jgi:hypothetical protein
MNREPSEMEVEAEILEEHCTGFGCACEKLP